MEPLTERQAEILRLIRELTEVSGFPPTRAEIARSMGFRSVNAAEQHLRALEKKGVLEILAGASRGLRVRDPRPAARLGRLMELPVIGRVAAGSPILAEAHVQGRYQLDPNLFTPRADYLLKVRGLSMRDAGILDGDLLAVHRSHEARSGQIVVARLADEVTVKRFRRRGNMVQLLPENPEFDPIELDLRQDELAIEGIGVGVIRSGKGL
ncbi:MAG: repressor LexA [Betaproteobacteria bacterium RIFCSPLOWO2_02_67_12]|nr:MAG: repressor LexA [Betaproteobacteria bacterium RIFCSPLOWO2_02_67_12]OGA26762.1 MAG: repressor LexA [Betaproteobacteria bacterium RIFCSPLOWO2_02_FULL_68_150]OGA64901.1 MAG: repressor LexA [Betaproteobacteria bacterium RIFCSPLOWO2_12_FULL_67_28]